MSATTLRINELVVATANTHWGELLDTPHGLDPLKHADVLLLQEVIDPNGQKVKNDLQKCGFRPVYGYRNYGLLIAVRADSHIQIVPRSTQKYLLQRMGTTYFELARRFSTQSTVFRERGLIAVKLKTRDSRTVTVATCHPVVSIEIRARNRQIRKIGKIVNDPYFNGPLIIGGDMNHYPIPKKVDERMLADAGLTRVDIENQPTWSIEGSTEEKYLHAVARLQRRSIFTYSGQLDAILYRGNRLQPIRANVVDIASDHRAIIATFTLNSQ